MENSENIKIYSHHFRSIGENCPMMYIQSKDKIKWFDESKKPDNETFLQWESDYNANLLKLKKEESIKDISDSIQYFMDKKAQEKGYDSIFTAVSYAEESAVAKFQQEGTAFSRWRSLVWEKCYSILADVEAGEREQPTLDELIVELPLLEI